MNGPGAARSAWHSARNTPAKQAAPRRPRTAEPAARSRVDGDHVTVSTAPPSAFDRVRDVQRRSSAVMRRVRSDTHVGAGAARRARSPVPDPRSATNDDDGDNGTFVEWWSAADATVHVRYGAVGRLLMGRARHCHVPFIRLTHTDTPGWWEPTTLAFTYVGSVAHAKAKVSCCPDANRPGQCLLQGCQRQGAALRALYQRLV